MAYEKKEGEGVLFTNKYKDKDDKPDYTGDILIDGRLIKIGGWVKQGRKGASNFISLRVSNYKKPEAVPF